MADRRERFIATYLPYAQEASALTGVDPGVILAQAAHETAWGRKAPGNNFFGIKGGGQTFATHEYVGGRRVNTRAGFRRYDDPRDSFLDWAELMHEPRYRNVLAARTPEEQIKALKAAGYATDPAYVSKLNSVRNQVTRIAGDIPQPSGVEGIMDVASLNTAPSSVPDQFTAASGYAPDLGMSGTPAQAAIADLISAPPELTADQIDQMTMVDADGNYLNPPAPAGPPMPRPPVEPPPQWAQAAGFPIDPELTGASADEVLMGGPRPSPMRPPMPASGPVGPTTAAGVLDVGPRLRPPDMFVINPVSGAPDASAVPSPNLNPRNMIASAPVGPTTPQGVLDMGPNLRPVDRWVAGAGGAPDASAVPTPGMRPDPFASTFPARPEGPASGMPAASFETPFAGRPELPATGFGPQFDMSAAIGGPPALPPSDLTPASAPIMADPLFNIDRELADSMDRMRSERESLNLANEIGFTRRNYIEPFQPAYRPPPDATMGERFDAANAFPDAGQMFSLPSLNDASFPAPPPVIGTAEAGSTTGEFFSPAPPMPAPPPDALSSRFDDAFAPAAPGMIADLPGAFANRQAQPTMTARDGIESVFGPTPAPAAEVPNLAIPFSQVPGFDMSRFVGSSPAEASPITSPLPQPAMAPPSITMADFDQRFGGGSVIRPPTPVPGQPGVVQGTMPTPAGAMDIRPPAQGGPALAPAAAVPDRAPPVAPPRQTNAGVLRNGGRGILGGIVGGALGGPIGALAGGLLGRSGIFGGGGGNGVGFGGQPSFAWSSGGNAPYGDGGSTTYQKGTSNALGGSNALSWKGSGGQQITVVQDPWGGGYYGPTTTGGSLY